MEASRRQGVASIAVPGAVNSTETDGESPAGDMPPSIDLSSVRSSLSGADSDEPSCSLRAIASAFDEAHASTSASQFRAECALCGLLDDPRRPLDGPRRLAALFVLARGGEALGADDGSGGVRGEKMKKDDASPSLSPFAETLRDWARSRSRSRPVKHGCNVSGTESLFLRRLIDPATRRAVGDAAPRAWLRENDPVALDDSRNDWRIDSRDVRDTDPRLESTRGDALFLTNRTRATAPERRTPPFLARAFDAERAWVEEADDGADSFLNSKPGCGVLSRSGFPRDALPLWDRTAGVPRTDSSREAYDATRAILEASTETPLAPMRRGEAERALRQNADFAGVVAADADAFRKMIDLNPSVAAAVLLATVRVPSARVARLPTLLGVLLENVGVHAMEVVANVFAEKREEASSCAKPLPAAFLPPNPLPAAFLTPFMAKCVRRCVDGDGGVGSRATHAHARLTCTFLKVLLRERHVAVADLPAEVESFCVEFMSMQEAADLFRLVKSLQREDAEGVHRVQRGIGRSASNDGRGRERK